MNIVSLLERNANLYPDDTALVEINPAPSNNPWLEANLVEADFSPARASLSWLQFNQAANFFAHFLRLNNISKGDHVAILLKNSLQWLPLYFAILKIGALAVPFNFRFTAEEIRYCCKLAQG